MVVVKLDIQAAQSACVWDSRKQSYSKVLARLKEASTKADVVDFGYNGGEHGYGPEAYFQSSARREEEAAAARAWANCKSAFDANQLLLSDGFLSGDEQAMKQKS